MRIGKKITTSIIAAAILGFVGIASAAPQKLTYQGRIVDSQGNPLNYNDVTFRFQITSSDGLCVLYYEERQHVNMQNSGGIFDIAIGDGNVIYAVGGLNQLSDSFINGISYNCYGGGTWTSTATSERLLKVSFNEGTGWQAINPANTIRSVPFAMSAYSAQTLADKTINDIVLKSSVATCTAGQALSWNGTSFSCVATSSGTLTGVTAGSGLSGGGTTGNVTLALSATGVTAGTYGSSTQVPVYSVDAQGRITSVTPTTISGIAPGGSAGGDLSGSYPNPTVANNAITSAKIADGTIVSADMDFTGTAAATSSIVLKDSTGKFAEFACSTVGQVATWTAVGWGCQTPSSTDATKLPLAGGTMSGAIDMANNNITNIGFMTMAASKSLHLSNNSSDPAGLTAADKGKMWFNSTTNEVKYWNGSAAVAVGSTGAAITDLSGDVTASGPGSATATISNSAVTNAKLANMAAYTLKGNNSGASAGPTDVTIASLQGTGANQFAAGNDARITGAIQAGASAGGDLSGTYPNPTVATGAITSAKILDGTINGVDMDFTGSNASTTGMVLKDTAGKFVNFTCSTNGQVPTWTASGFSCQSPSPLLPSLADTKIWVGNSGTATAVSVSGDASLANDGTLSLAASGVTAGTYTKVTVDAKGRVTTGASLASSDITTALGFTPVNKAGDVMTGSLGLGNYTNATEATLITGWGASDKGKTWFNTTTNQVKYWDGSAAQALGVSGAGLTSLNGQTGSTQTFSAPGTSGTAPAWSSSSNAHTLNIPMASAAGVTAGLLSKTDYDSFAAKQDAGNYVTALTGDVTASGPGSAAATIAAGAVTSSKIASGTIVAGNMDFTGVNAGTANLVIKDSSGKFYDFGCSTAGYVATWTVSGWACQPISVSGSNFGSQTQATFFAAPAGADGTPTFRTISSTDLPITGATGAYINGGNSFGTAASIGTNDSNKLSLKTAGTDRLIIDTAGNVGFGGTPSYKAHIRNGILAVKGDAGSSNTPSTESVASFDREAAGGVGVNMFTMNAQPATIYFGNTSTPQQGAIKYQVDDFTTTNQYLAFRVNSAERMRINSAGKVGIGTTNPGYALDVAGDVNITGNFKVNGTNIATGGGTITALTGDVTASGTGSVAATIAAGAVTSSKIASGTIVGGNMDFTGSNASTTGIVLKDTTGKFVNFTCSTNGEIPTWTASGFACQSPSPLLPSLADTKIWVGNSGTATAVSVSGDASLANDGTLTLAASGVTAGTYTKVTVDAKGRVTTGASLASSDVTTALGYTPVNKAGDVMTGSLGLGNYTNATEATLITGWGASDKGKTWFNTSTNQVKYWDGSAAQALGVSGAGLTSLNGQTGSTQTFATPGTSGTAPAWSSSSNAHTLNIPMASATGVTAGLLSKTDYDAFTAKQAAGNYVTALTGDVTASGPGSAAATIAAGAVTSSKIASGTIVGGNMDFTGVNAGTANLVIKDSSGKFANFGCSSAGDVATWTVTGWACQTPSPLLPSLADGKIWVGNSGTATAVTMSGDATISNAGALTLAASGVTAGTYTKVTVDAKGRVTTGASLASSDVTTALGYTPVNKAGDVMTGSLGLGNYTDATEGTLTSGFGASDKGKTWFNTTSNVVKYWDGSAIKVVGSVGSAIVSLNGLSGTTQTFATGTSGTDFAISSSGSAHTFNLPSSSATNRGLLTSADWTTFNNKLGTATTFAGDVSGAYNTTSVDKIKGKSVVPVAYSAGQTLRYDGTNWVNAALGFSDLSGKPTTLAGYGITDAMSSTLADGKIWVGNSGTATAVTMSGDATLSNAGALTLAASGVTAGTYTKVTVDAKGRVTTGASLASSDVTTALGYTPVNKAGDVMTGSLGLGNYTDATEGTLTSGFGASDKGKTWFNTTSNVVKYWDGSAIKVMESVGSAIVSLNGLSTTTQTFATPGTSGTAPAWSSSGSAHTLNIPMASAAGVTAGLLSKTDYDAFTAKQAAGNYITALTGDVTASGPGSAAATIAAGAVTTSKIASGTILGSNMNYTGVNAGTSNLVIKDSTGKFYDFGCSTAGYVATWTVSGWACQAISVSGTNFGSQTQATFFAAPAGSSGTPTFRTIASTDLPITGSTGAYINGGNSFGTAASIGTADANNLTIKTNGSARMTFLSGGNVGIGQTSPSYPLDVTGGSSGDYTKSTIATDSSIALGGFDYAAVTGKGLLLAKVYDGTGTHKGYVYFSTPSGNGAAVTLRTADQTKSGSMQMMNSDGHISFQTNGTERLAVGYSNTITASTAVVGTPSTVAAAAVDLSTSNTQTLASVGGSTITLSNMANGGHYTLVITDTTSRTYTFSGCNTSKYSPSNQATVAGTPSIYSIITIYNGSTYDCYITWSTGYN